MDLPQHEPHPDPATQARADRARFRRAALASLAFVAVLGWIMLAEHWLGDFRALALRPGTPAGLVGILTAPLLHGGLGHLSANGLALIVLGTLALAVYPKASLRALPLVWLLSGLGVWLTGQPGSAHIGASGLTHGLMFFVFLLGVLRRDRPAVAAAMIAFFLYGGMLMTVLPREHGISWEYHLFGALSGILAALLWRRLDPAPPRRRYSWEDEPEDAGPPSEASQFELPSPREVPVLWRRPADERGVVLRFPGRPSPPARREDE